MVDLCMVDGGASVADGLRLRAWRPRVPGVAEVFHAHMTDHVYPMHAHDSWTLLIVDDGMVRYDLHRHEHGALDQVVTLLPPHVPHNGRAATSEGFRKRVVYLDFGQLPEKLIGRAADRPVLTDPVLRLRVGQLHEALGRPGDELEAESRLALITDRLRHNLQHHSAERPVAPALGIAYRLRDLLDSSVPETILLRDAAARLQAHPAHLVRAFSAEFGISPHQYVTGRRVDLARGFLLGGMPASQVATEAGFYDQAHLTRHFRNVLGTTPGRFARSGPGSLLTP